MKRCKKCGKLISPNVMGLWPKIPYAGESRPPIPEDPTAGEWPTFFFGRTKDGKFTDKNGNIVNFNIRIPNSSIDFRGRQLSIVEETIDDITPQQIRIAEYWGDGPATKQWTPIIDRLIDSYNVTAPRAARILANTQAALNDAFVISWYFKFLWNIPRPNQLNRNLATVLCTPNHPSYPSGHAVVAGCAQVVLSYFFVGQKCRLKQLADECALSRLYAGVHYPIDNSQGLKLGRQIGEIIVNQLENQTTLQGEKVDISYTRSFNAKLPPPPYVQAIPFERNMKCKSETIFNT